MIATHTESENRIPSNQTTITAICNRSKKFLIIAILSLYKLFVKRELEITFSQLFWNIDQESLNSLILIFQSQ